MIVVLLALIASVVVPIRIAVQAAETPRRGGVLLAVIAADPPSLDPHQESTFATIQLVAPLYSTLLQIDPYNFPKIIGDAATEWKAAPDGLTYTFKIRPGMRFHDGSPLTADDVKATYDKIVFPPAGVLSIRKNAYTQVERVEAPDPSTVVFKLKFPSASFMANVASPWNVIYPKKYLDKDPNYFKTNVVGSGPFKFKGYTRGSTFEGERNPDYFVKDRPYLDGYKFYISPETSVRAAAIRSGRAYIEFRDLPLAEVEAIRKQLGDKVTVQTTPVTGRWNIAPNTTVKPFNDVRVRKALTLGIDRYTMSKVLYPLTGLRDIGGLMRPGSDWAMAPAALEKLPGFGRDVEKNRAEAKRLLAEAGYPNGLKVVLKNRNVKLPYQDFAVFVIQEWRKIGVEAQNRPLETAAWFDDGQNKGNFELMVAPSVEFMDDPDQFLGRYVTGSTQNWARFSDPQIDDLFSRQARALDPVERKKLINELEKIVLREGVHVPGALVDAERGPLVQGEELRGPAQSLHQPEAPGRLVGGGLTGSTAMRTYLAKRLLLIVPTLIGAAALVFLIMRVIPGDVALLILGGDQGQIDRAQLAAMHRRLGLDEPLLVQFGTWLWGVLRFDFGNSLWTGRPVVEEVLIRLPLSLELALLATMISVLIAIPFGMLAAVRQDTWVDYLVRVISIGGLAIPSFWVGILVILLLVIYFGWGPPLEFTPPWVDPWANFQQMVWPVITVGYRYAAVTTRMTRSTLLEVLREDYIRTAWAKGLRERAIVIRHALKNAMLPVITLIGTEFAFLIGGLVVTETVFTLNGVGRFVVDAVAHRDYPVVQALVFLIAFGFVIVNLLIDLTYAWFDPRIRYR